MNDDFEFGANPAEETDKKEEAAPGEDYIDLFSSSEESHEGDDEHTITIETPEEKEEPVIYAEQTENHTAYGYYYNGQQEQYQQPQYGQPQYGQPQYGQPQYGQPQYGQPQYSQPQYAQPQYAQPQAPEKKKSGKGIKIFLAILAVLMAAAIILGVSAMIKLVVRKTGIKAPEESVLTTINGDVDLEIAPVPEAPAADSNSGAALTTTQIAAKVRASNVGIVVYTNGSNSSAGEGSGVIMKEDSSFTYIVTCAHVISDAGVSVQVQTEDGKKYDAEIVGFDTRTDLGVVRIKARGLHAAEFGDSNALQVGDPVYAVGNPGGVEFFGSFTGGYVAAIDRPISSDIGYTMKCIQHSSAINPGNSGGALANQYGQVIGINSQKIAATDFEGIGFAIPISSAKPIIESLISYGYVPNRPMLGITYYSLSASAQYSMIAQIKGLPAGTLIINDISNESSLANTQARKYDMITKVNGKELATADVLLELIDNGKVGDKLTLTLCRVNSDYSIDEYEVEAFLVEDKGGSEPVTTTQQYINPFDYFGNFGFGF